MCPKDDTQRRIRDTVNAPHVPAVLCREEAMVYLENYLRGSRAEADMQALHEYLTDLPVKERLLLPVGFAQLMEGLVTDLARISDAQGPEGTTV